MKMIKKFFVGRKVSEYLMLATCVLGIVAIVFYTATGVNNFNPNYSALYFAMTIIAVTLAAVSFVLPLRVCNFAAYLCFLVAIIEYVITQVNYIANLIYSVDGEIVSAGLVIIIICLVFGMVASLVAGILNKHDYLTCKLKGNNTSEDAL